MNHIGYFFRPHQLISSKTITIVECKWPWKSSRIIWILTMNSSTLKTLRECYCVGKSFLFFHGVKMSAHLFSAQNMYFKWRILNGNFFKNYQHRISMHFAWPLSRMKFLQNYLDSFLFSRPYHELIFASKNFMSILSNYLWIVGVIVGEQTPKGHWYRLF